MIIKSRANKHYKLLKRLLSKKGRYREQLYIAEGYRFLDFNPKVTYGIEQGDFILSEALFKELSSLENSEGVISLFDINTYSIEELSDRAVILYQIQDPGNMGTIIRTMVSFGVDSLILSKGCCDPFNPKVVRATMGAINRVKISFIDSLSEAQKQYKIIAADIKGENISSLKQKEKFGLLLGNESNGIPKDENIERYTIPIKEMESLNVSVAASIFIYVLTN